MTSKLNSGGKMTSGCFAHVFKNGSLVITYYRGKGWNKIDQT
jgi:hypothetical protein